MESLAGSTEQTHMKWNVVQKHSTLLIVLHKMCTFHRLKSSVLVDYMIKLFKTTSAMLHKRYCRLRVQTQNVCAYEDGGDSPLKKPINQMLLQRAHNRREREERWKTGTRTQAGEAPPSPPGDSWPFCFSIASFNRLQKWSDVVPHAACCERTKSQAVGRQGEGACESRGRSELKWIIKHLS